MTESVCLYVGEREKDGLRERERLVYVFESDCE